MWFVLCVCVCVCVCVCTHISGEEKLVLPCHFPFKPFSGLPYLPLLFPLHLLLHIFFLQMKLHAFLPPGFVNALGPPTSPTWIWLFSLFRSLISFTPGCLSWSPPLVSHHTWYFSHHSLHHTLLEFYGKLLSFPEETVSSLRHGLLTPRTVTWT